MKLDFENIYHLFTIFATFLFSFYLLMNQKKGRRGNVFIGLFILFIGLGSLDYLLTINFYKEHPATAMILPAFSFLFFPLMYFYILSIAFNGFKLEWKHSIHLIVFVFFSVSMFFEYHIYSTEIQYIKLTSTDGFRPWFLPTIYVLLHLQALFYMVLSILAVLKYKKLVNENYSSLKNRNYKWIISLTFVFVFITLSGLFRNIMRFFINPEIDDYLIYIMAPLNFLFLIWLIYKAMSQPFLFTGIDTQVQLVEDYIKENKLLEKRRTLENEEEFNNEDTVIMQQLESYMQEQNAFLNPSLSIFDLAKGLGFSSNQLSVFLNRRLNKNFFDFVNDYRINLAKEILSDPIKKKTTVLEILYKVRFNSKSSFNTAFKKSTGLTPSEYRKVNMKA